MIKNERDGQDAGTKDVLVVGAPPRKRKIKNTLPPFKPEDCGFNYGNRRTKVEQAGKAHKFMRRGTLKSE